MSSMTNNMKSYRRYKGNSPQNKKRHWLAALLILLGLGLVLFGALEIAISLGSRGRTAENGGGPEIMIIFGCQVRKDGPSILLRDRLETALAYWEEHPDIKIVVTGGKGDDEHQSEAQAMYDYLTARGVSGNTILMEDKSRNTQQNIQNTWDSLCGQMGPWDSILLPDKCSYVLVSSDFHLARILMLWQRATGRLDNVSTLPAPVSHAPSRVQMFFREPLALVKSFLFDR